MNIKNNIQLKEYNSFRTKAVARLWCEPQTVEELSEVIKAFPNENKLILGAGNNLFFTKDFGGLVIKPGIKDFRVISDNTDSVEIEAGAGIEWDEFVEACVQKGYSGLENLSLIPGSVGASPIQNIGAYGSEVKDTITKVVAIDNQTGEIKEFTNEECGFGYRDSIFKQTRQYIISSVTFRLSKLFTYKEKYVDVSRELKDIPSPSILQVREAIIRIRERKLPSAKVLPNAGSFFKNPIISKEEKDMLLKADANIPVFNAGDKQFKTSAAYLIEKSGYKGKRNSKGTVGTYEHHALVIVNYGTDDGKEIIEFSGEIQDAVFKEFGVKLEPEVWVF